MVQFNLISFHLCKLCDEFTLLCFIHARDEFSFKVWNIERKFVICVKNIFSGLKGIPKKFSFQENLLKQADFHKK